MSTDRTCNSSFWTKEEDKIFENTLAFNFKDNNNPLKKMAEAPPGKSVDDIKEHYNILIEDINAIESGRVPLPNYPEMQSDSNQNSKADVEWRKRVSWTEQEHRSFIWGLDIYGKGDWRSISRHCVITRTATQVASHAQKFFKHLEATNKRNRRARASVLDITSVDAEATVTSQVPHTEDMIGSAYGGSQAVPNTSNESMLPQESTNAEQMIEVVGGESSGHNAAFVHGMNSMYPDVNVDAGRSLLPSKQPCTAASSGTYSHPITRIGSKLEALLTEPMDEDNDISSIFDVGKAPTSDAMLFNAAHSGMSGYALAGVAPAQLPAFTPSSDTPVDDEGIFDPDDLFTDQMF